MCICIYVVVSLILCDDNRVVTFLTDKIYVSHHRKDIPISKLIEIMENDKVLLKQAQIISDAIETNPIAYCIRVIAKSDMSYSDKVYVVEFLADITTSDAQAMIDGIEVFL